MFPLGLWSNLLRFFDAADTEAENKKEQQIAIRIAEIENTFNFFIEHLRSLWADIYFWQIMYSEEIICSNHKIYFII